MLRAGKALMEGRHGYKIALKEGNGRHFQVASACEDCHNAMIYPISEMVSCDCKFEMTVGREALL